MDSPMKKRILTIIQSHDIIEKRQKRGLEDESIEEDNKKNR